MRRATPWLVLFILAITASVLALLNFEPAAVAAQQVVSPGLLSPRHAYLSEQCSACHEPTVGVTVAKCTACHANSEQLLGRQPTAFHASVQTCSGCHIEHQAAGVRPVAMDHLALAKLGARTRAGATSSDSDSAATLNSLETWLRIKRPGQIGASSARCRRTPP